MIRARTRDAASAGPSGHPRVVGGRPLHKATVTGWPDPLAIADHDGPSRQHGVGLADDLPALVAAVVDVHVMRRGRDRPRHARVVDHEVRVRPDRNRALAWI